MHSAPVGLADRFEVADLDRSMQRFRNGDHLPERVNHAAALLPHMDCNGNAGICQAAAALRSALRSNRSSPAHSPRPSETPSRAGGKLLLDHPVDLGQLRARRASGAPKPAAQARMVPLPGQAWLYGWGWAVPLPRRADRLQGWKSRRPSGSAPVIRRQVGLESLFDMYRGTASRTGRSCR